MKSIKYILLVSTCCFISNEGRAEINLTFDISNLISSNPTLHTHTPNVELKPISNFVKLAAVCSITEGGCSGGGFDYDLDMAQQCRDDGYNLSGNCPAGKIKSYACPYDSTYYKKCSCDKSQYSEEFIPCGSDKEPTNPNDFCEENGHKYYPKYDPNSANCKCISTIYPYTYINCLAPQVLSGTNCSDTSSQHYTQCSCPAIKSCDLGCKTYHASPCGSICKDCKTCFPAPVPEGYTANDRSCGNDEIKKVFSDGCETNYYKCENSCVPETGHIYYSDGTCSAINDTTKKPIGLVYWVGARKKSGLIMSLDEPSDKLWNSAINYCYSYVKHGVIGWKLPKISEFIPMGVEKTYGVSNNKFNILNAKLATISGAKQMTDYSYWSGSEAYNVSDYAWLFIPSKGISAHSGTVIDVYVPLCSVRCVLAF